MVATVHQGAACEVAWHSSLASSLLQVEVECLEPFEEVEQPVSLEWTYCFHLSSYEYVLPVWPSTSRLACEDLILPSAMLGRRVGSCCIIATKNRTYGIGNIP